MTIVREFLEIMEKVNKSVDLPKIKQLLFPSPEKIDRGLNDSHFAAIILEGNTIGVVYINLIPEVKRKPKPHLLERYQGLNPYDVAKSFNSSDFFEKTIALGTINAISQYIFKKSRFLLNFNENSLGIDVEKGDIVGMVGFFPPLVKQITKLGNKLIIIEKKSNMVKETANWKVTLDPSELKECTKVLITSTTVLNNTLDDILINCAKAKQISVIGPSAGYFPDPLFSKGVNVIGGTYITNPEVFIDLFKNNEKWGPATKKYAIDRKDYPGYKSILQMISDN